LRTVPHEVLAPSRGCAGFCEVVERAGTECRNRAAAEPGSSRSPHHRREAPQRVGASRGAEHATIGLPQHPVQARVSRCQAEGDLRAPVPQRGRIQARCRARAGVLLSARLSRCHGRHHRRAQPGWRSHYVRGEGRAPDCGRTRDGARCARCHCAGRHRACHAPARGTAIQFARARLECRTAPRAPVEPRVRRRLLDSVGHCQRYVARRRHRHQGRSPYAGDHRQHYRRGQCARQRRDHSKFAHAQNRRPVSALHARGQPASLVRISALSSRRDRHGRA
jgi:hypothetical protein